jgi:DNA-binding PadR family transcriptional regulator
LHVLRVLDAIASTPRISGSDISSRTSLPSGTLYPLLTRLRDAGWVFSEWEQGDAAELGRPLKRFYSLTNDGKKAANDAAMEMQGAIARLSA